MWRTLGSPLGDHGEHLPVLRVYGRSVDMLSWPDGKGQGHLNLAPSSPSYHLGLKQGLMGLAGLGTQYR